MVKKFSVFHKSSCQLTSFPAYLKISCLLLAVIFTSGCSDEKTNDKGNTTQEPITCHDDAECVHQSDGRTKCNLDNNTCVNPQDINVKPVCTETSPTTCQNNVMTSCVGGKWKKTDCEYGCQDSTKCNTEAPKCNPGCLAPENTKLISCNEDGTAVETPCPYGCVDNACVEPECEFDGTYCEGGELVTCQELHITDRKSCEFGCTDGQKSCDPKYKTGDPCDDESFTTICDGKYQVWCSEGQIERTDCTKTWGSDGVCLQRTLEDERISTTCLSKRYGTCTELNAIKLQCDEDNEYLEHYDCLSDGKDGLYWSNTINWRDLPNWEKHCIMGCQEDHCIAAPIGTVKTGNCKDSHTCADIIDSNYSCVIFDDETYRCMRPCSEEMDGLNGYEAHHGSCYYYECKKLGDSWWFDYIRQESYVPCNSL